MSRKGYADIKQQIDTIKTEFHGFGNAVAQDLMRLHHLLYTMLDNDGKLERIVCHSCEQEVLRPKLDNLEQSDDCPNCGKDLYKGKQTSIEAWDNDEEE
jgi:PHP family Zn ribbon phosphoesterase